MTAPFVAPTLSQVLTEPERHRLVTEIEVYFRTKGTLPSVSLLRLRKLIYSASDLTLISEALQNRGLPTYDSPPVGNQVPVEEFSEKLDEPDFVESGLDPRAVLAAGLIVDMHDRRSVGSKLKQVGITTREWQGFLMDPNFSQYFNTLVQTTKNQASASATLGLVKLINNDDLSAIKYYHEMTGEYRPQREDVFNVGLVIAKMMEILVAYLKPEQLNEIAEKLEDVIDVTGYEQKQLVKGL